MARKPGSGQDEGPRGREAFEEIDRRLGDMLGPLGAGIGAALGRIVEAAEKAAEQPGGKPGGAAGAASPFHVSGGLRMRVGDQEFTSSFGDAQDEGDAAPPRREARAAPVQPEDGEPAPAEYECWTEGRTWVLTAEIPGATPGAISLDISGGTLTATISGDPPRRIRVDAPPVALGAIDMRLANGVLELRAELPG